MDKLVIDIETSNTFQDVGGRGRVKELDISLAGIYSYKHGAFYSFGPENLNDLEPFFKTAGLVIGFAINRFDIPVLQKYFSFNLLSLPRLDLLDEIELATGGRVSLNILAETNLGIRKTYESGLHAIKLYREGNFEELKKYCLNDVKITRELYELAKRQGYLVIPEKLTGALNKVSISCREIELPATLF